MDCLDRMRLLFRVAARGPAACRDGKPLTFGQSRPFMDAAEKGPDATSLTVGAGILLALCVGVQAGELPVPQTDDYARVCDAFGTGFHYIQGIETCLRSGGRVRIEAHYVDSLGAGDHSNNREISRFSTRARGYVRLESRTETDIGLVRAYVRMALTRASSGGFLDFSRDEDEDRETRPWLERVFIQLTGARGMFTAGHESSYFDFWGSNTFSTRVGVDDPTTEATLAAYTLGDRNGFSASLSLEDPASADRRRDPDNTDARYGGLEAPDFVGNVRFEHDRGSVQAMAALRRLQGRVASGPVQDAEAQGMFGWAAGLGAEVDLPFGLNVVFQATYANGMLAYATNDPGEVGDFAADAQGDIKTNSAWSVRSGVVVSLSKRVDANLDASFTRVNDRTSGSRDYEIWGAAANLVVEPVKGLSLGPELAYTSIHPENPDGPEDIWGVMLRVQRDF